MNSRILGLILFVAAMVFFASPLTIAQQRKAQPPGSVRLYVFDCGKLDIQDITPYQLTRAEIATNVMSVPCFLIAHPRGTLMWDAGAVPDRLIPTGGMGTLRAYGTSTRKLETQLGEIGACVPTLFTFPSRIFIGTMSATRTCSRARPGSYAKAERDAMFSDPSPRTEPENFSALKTSKTTIITTADYDVFGDGSVVIKSAPGHSPDHQVLFVNLPRTGPIVLSGDLYHYPEERTLKKVPTTEFNPAQTAASRAAIEAFLARTHARLWIQHDFNAIAKLNKSPAYYD